MIKDYIAILDFGSQYAHLISRRVRQLGVLSKIYQQDIPVKQLRNEGDNGPFDFAQGKHYHLHLSGIILSGGPASVTDESALAYDRKIFNLGVPILGLCYGHQLIAHHFGGEVKHGHTKEYGRARLAVKNREDLLAGLGSEEQIWMSHWDTVVKPPAKFKVLGSTADCPVAAMAWEQKKIYSLQFHPEVHHTTHGLKILANFLYKICRLKPDWKVQNYLPEIIREIKEKVGEDLNPRLPKQTPKKVFLLVSGGVDSTVCFALLNKVLGPERVYGLHVDTGFMRLNESQKVNYALIKAGFDNLHIIRAEKQFFSALKNIVDPEAKRKIIGRLYFLIQEQAMKRLKLNPREWLLAQGTIYPDTIESGGTKKADKIKTHHNRVPEALKLIRAGKLIEPLKNLYKDEVRELGVKLGLDPKLVNRHPFPGPGLAIRIICANRSKKLKIKDKKFINQRLEQLVGKYNSQYKLKLSAWVLPVKSVGVQGDVRSYRHPAVICGRADYKVLDKLATEITNSISEINRVVWLLASKQISSQARLQPKTLTLARVKLLQRLDDAVMSIIREQKVYQSVWQFPNVLVPFGQLGESLVLRPVESAEAMTVNFYRLPPKILRLIIRAVKKFSEIDYLFYDLTNKPPATIEWE